MDINYQRTNLQTDLYDQIPNIEVLCVDCMDLFTYTIFLLEKRVSISMIRTDDFSSIGLICDRIEKLSITRYFTHNHISKLFSVCDKFRDLLELDIHDCEVNKLEKEMFDGFSKLRSLKIKRSKNFNMS